MPKLSIVIPCYNEAESIPSLLERIKASMDRDDVEVILVNDGSKDNTAEVLAQHARGMHFIKIVTNLTNQGYGGAILEGLKAARGQYIGWMHGDLQTPFKDALVALKAIEESSEPEHLYIKGLRLNRPLFDQFFTVGMSIFESILLWTPLWDINAQPNIFPRSFFDSWQNPPRDFSIDLYSFYQARKGGLRIMRIPVIFPPREFGHSSWNFGFKSKFKFIARTIEFSMRMRFGISPAHYLELLTLFKYLFAGGSGALLNLLLLFFFTDVLGIYYLISTSLAFFILFVLSFFIHKYWTFREHSSHRMKRQMVMYFCLHAGNFITNGVLMYLLTSILGLWYMFSQFVVLLFIAAVTFSLNKKFIFKR